MMHNKALVCVGSQLGLFLLFAGWHWTVSKRMFNKTLCVGSQMGLFVLFAGWHFG